MAQRVEIALPHAQDNGLDVELEPKALISRHVREVELGCQRSEDVPSRVRRADSILRIWIPRFFGGLHLDPVRFHSDLGDL